MSTNDNEILPKLCSKFYCESCDYVFISKLYMDKHIEGKLHKFKVKSLELLANK